LKSDDFDGTNYKRWRAKMVLWLTATNCYYVAQGKPKQFTAKEEQRFVAADNMFRDAVISTLHSKYDDNYIICTTCKQLWDVLDAQFGVSDGGNELDIMEQLYNYKIVDNRSIVEEAHEIQALTKKLE
jgi:hypothetical protein